MSEQIHFNKLKDFGVFGRGPQIMCDQVHVAHKWNSLIPSVVYSNMTHKGDKWFNFYKLIQIKFSYMHTIFLVSKQIIKIKYTLKIILKMQLHYSRENAVCIGVMPIWLSRHFNPPNLLVFEVFFHLHTDFLMQKTNASWKTPQLPSKWDEKWLFVCCMKDRETK